MQNPCQLLHSLHRNTSVIINKSVMLKARVACVDVIPHLLSRNVPSLVMRASNFHGQEKEECNFLNSDVQSFISPSSQLPGLCTRAPCSCA